MNKKGMLLFSAFLIFLMGATIASAVSDVAYIYRKTFKVDNNIIDAFTDAGLSVELINENTLPRDFSGYKVIFVGDEIFTKEDLIPVNDFPSIIVNYYHSDTWGFTDNDGVSQLAANHPLSVVKNGQMIQVYTMSGNGIGGAALPYYFLDVENKAPSLETIALTEVTSSGSDFGDVISVAHTGAQLFNGKTQNANLCFFGIVKSDFWTPSARAMFQDCIGHVVSTCQVDTDCPASVLTEEPFCQSGDVYQNERTNTCQNFGLENQCVPADGAVLIEDCQFGCFDGECIVPNCVENTDCGLDGFIDGEFCSADGNVAREFETFTCNNPGTANSFCSSETEEIAIQSCSDTCVAGECIGFQCTQNTDCGLDGFIDGEFCSADGNVAREFETFTCNNPGTANSFCSSEISEETIEQCSDSCVAGECQEFECEFDSDCYDNNPLTLDECIHPASIISECRNTPVNCNSNNDCGFTGFLGQEFCSIDNVAKNFQTATCINPGETTSFCEIEVTTEVVGLCDFACSEGACVRCDENLDCDDGDSNSADICHNAGTAESFCSNEDLTPEIACSEDSDCGEDATLSEPFCSANEVKKLVLNWDCRNPGTTESFCSSTLRSDLVETCSNFCSEGSCVEIECFANSDCNDSDDLTLDICTNAGTAESFCSNTPIDVICFEDSDCGTDGQIGGNICVGSEITNLFLEFDCNNAGTANSFCSSTLTQEVSESCDFACSEGACVPAPAICGNGIVEEGESCDDGNLIDGDGCSSVCAIDECSPGETRECGESDVGMCSFGTETCGQDGFFGECIGEVGPTTEICDDFDNDCDGFNDEGDICVPIITQCSDGLDNDGDGFTDFPEDPSCSSPQDDSETPFDFPQCDDGFDNDGDGFIDFPADPDCDNLLDNTEGA